MEQVQMECWAIDISKVNRFSFLNEEVEEFTSRCSQNLVNVRSSTYSKQKNLHTWLSICIMYMSWIMLLMHDKLMW